MGAYCIPVALASVVLAAIQGEARADEDAPRITVRAQDISMNYRDNPVRTGYGPLDQRLDLSLASDLLEERGVCHLEGFHDECSAQISVAALTRSLRDEGARVARGAMKGLVLRRIVLGAEWVRRADLRAVERLSEEPA